MLITPEPPRLLPLRQEDGRIAIHWFAPRLAEDGSADEIRLRKAIILYRVVDIRGLAAEQRASHRYATEEDEADPEEEGQADDTGDTSLPGSASDEQETVAGAESGTGDTPADESDEPDAAPVTEEPPPSPEAEPGAAPVEPVLPEPDPGGAPAPAGEEVSPREEQREPPARSTPDPPDRDPVPPDGLQEGGPPAEESEAAADDPPDDLLPPEPEPATDDPPDDLPPPEPEPTTDDSPDDLLPPEPEPATDDPPDDLLPPEPEPATDDPPDDLPPPEPEPTADDPPDDLPPPEPEPTADDPPDDLPPPEPEPAEVVLEYEEIEFEVLSEIESEVRGEERLLEWPVPPEWVGRRFEVAIRYESRGGPSEESERQSLDLALPLPPAREVTVEIGEQALTVRWLDPRPGLLPDSELADPIFEVFRRRGDRNERVGRSLGPALADREVAWGEEVCYRVRILLAGDDEERLLPDPGPEFDPVNPDPVSPGAPDMEETPGNEAEELPAPPDHALPVEARDSPEAPAPAGGLDPPEVVGQPGGAPDSETSAWRPVPVRVPPTGSTALSVGPFSAETCVTPSDVFPPPAPSDLRLFWRPERTELSWKESFAADLVGYHIYRSLSDGSAPERLTDTPVEITAFSDSDRDPAASYRYFVTAVDAAAAANESPPSAPALAIPRR